MEIFTSLTHPLLMNFLQLEEFEKLIEELIKMKTLFTGYEVAPIIAGRKVFAA
jgi:hypothetical protein